MRSNSTKKKSEKEPVQGNCTCECQHVWGKWTTTHSGTWTARTLYGGGTNGVLYVQERYCTLCGEVEFQKVSI
jgi:hypothetical protein